jgi:hypothetical protein
MAKREAKLSNNGSSTDNSWLSPIEQRTFSLRQETAELRQKIFKLRQETAAIR